MPDLRKKIILPYLNITSVALEGDLGAQKVTFSGEFKSSELPEGYFIRPLRPLKNEGSSGGGVNFHQFPVVVDSSGVPWEPAVIYLLSRLEGISHPVMSTYSSIAGDLMEYRRFIDESKISWAEFPVYKLDKPTYRFNSYLKRRVALGEIALSTAKRQMSSVQSFYRWLDDEGLIDSRNGLWNESDRYVQIENSYGAKSFIPVKVTDVSIRNVKKIDPLGGLIMDGGQLRPLGDEEQEWLLDALRSLGNVEMSLIHLIGLCTGARLQTVLTLRLRDFLQEPKNNGDEFRLPVGPGTGVDTKFNQQQSIIIPRSLFEYLVIYANSSRSKLRRSKSKNSNENDEILFLSQHGSPFYDARNISANQNEAHRARRYLCNGQGIRDFVGHRIIPYIRSKYHSGFQYKFHDTRATFGMNLTDYLYGCVERGEMSLARVREIVSVRMCHKSFKTTELYLGYRVNQKALSEVNEGWDRFMRNGSWVIESL